MAKKSNSSRMGCETCAWSSHLGNCIKYGVNIKDDVNRGTTLHSLVGGIFHTSDIKGRCPSWTDPATIERQRKLGRTRKEKERKAFLERVRECGSQMPQTRVEIN